MSASAFVCAVPPLPTVIRCLGLSGHLDRREIAVMKEIANRSVGFPTVCRVQTTDRTTLAPSLEPRRFERPTLAIDGHDASTRAVNAGWVT